MQPIRNTLRRVPQNIHRVTKPASISTRSFTHTPATMSLFPRFTQEFAPLFRLMDDYDRRVIRDFPNVQSFTPKFDVKEVNDAYELHGEFPGIEQKDINIEWTDANTLTISGRHEHVREEGQRPTAAIEDGSSKGGSKHYEKPKVEDENDAGNKQVAETSKHKEVAKQDDGPKYWVSERSVGEFHRSFSFPTRVDQDAVKASLKNGILSVVVPKAKTQQPKKIAIE